MPDHHLPERTIYTIICLREGVSEQDSDALNSGYGYEMEMPERVPRSRGKDDSRNQKLS